MAPDEPTTDYYPPPPPQPSAAPPVKRLVRSRRDRKFAGVCGGLGEYFDLDPIIFRIAFVVLTLAGGGGLLLYGLAWVFVPEEGHRRAIGDSLPGARRGRPHWLPIALLVVGGLMLSGQLSDHHNGGFGFGFTLLAVGGFLLWRRQQRQTPWNDGGHDDVAAPRPPPSDMYPPRWTPSPDPTVPTDAGARDPNVPWTAPGVTPWTPADDGVDTGTDAFTTARDPLLDEADRLPFSPPPVWPPLDLQPEARRPPSMTPVLLSALLLLGGVAALLTTSGVWHVSVAVYLSVALILTGVTLVVGSGRPRSRGLIALGVVLTLALIVAATVEAPLRDGVGERIYTPATVSQVRQNYRLGAGHLKLDLSHLAIWQGPRTRTVDLHLGAGELDVITPSNTNVKIDAESQLGQVQVFGQTRNNGNKLTVVEPKPASSDEPTLVLHLHVRLGQVQVTHAAA